VTSHLSRRDGHATPWSNDDGLTTASGHFNTRLFWYNNHWCHYGGWVRCVGGCGGYQTRTIAGYPGKSRDEILDNEVLGWYGKGCLAYLEEPEGP
jgi:hypothetical protein